MGEEEGIEKEVTLEFFWGVLKLNFRPWGIHLENMSPKLFFFPT